VSGPRDPPGSSSAATAGENLRFEPLGPDHAAALFPLLGDARVWQHIQGSDGATEEQMRAAYARRAAGSTRPGERWMNFAVRLSSDPYLGRVEATVHDQTWAEIAYVFGLSHRGRGYARAAVSWLLGQVGVGEVWAAVAPSNERSRRLLLALGFREAPPSRALASWDPGDLTFRWDRPG
jgi:RimJ/RimL family protein N-acetyltransferase